MTEPGNTLVCLTNRLDFVSEQLLALGKSVVDENREEEPSIDYLDNPPVLKPLGAGLAHVETHGMHHRAQCLYIMRQLGLSNLIEGDAISWEKIHYGMERWPDAKINVL